MEKSVSPCATKRKYLAECLRKGLIDPSVNIYESFLKNDVSVEYIKDSISKKNPHLAYIEDLLDKLKQAEMIDEDKAKFYLSQPITFTDLKKQFNIGYQEEWEGEQVRIKKINKSKQYMRSFKSALTKMRNPQNIAKFFDLANCSVKYLSFYFEKKFGASGWTKIDFIIPWQYFDLSKKSQRDICFNYKNLKPLNI